jgi:quinol-cytochrome oxidoreductase complex cytochrome b subunit
MSERVRDPKKAIKTARWDGYLRDGPGATITAVPVVEVNGEHAAPLEAEYKRMRIGPDHILYPVVVSLGSLHMLLGGPGQHLADDMPEDDTHPFFPDHFWPYPVIWVVMLVTVGLLSAFVQQNVQLEQPADPRATGVIPRPDWYFLWLFQSLKLWNEFVMAYIVPALIVGGLLLWPFIDNIVGTRLARKLNWATWPVPGRNLITGTGWILFLGLIVMLTFWALAGVTIFGISGG